jgi:hypothetical protein
VPPEGLGLRSSVTGKTKSGRACPVQYALHATEHYYQTLLPSSFTFFHRFVSWTNWAACRCVCGVCLGGDAFVMLLGKGWWQAAAKWQFEDGKIAVMRLHGLLGGCWLLLWWLAAGNCACGISLHGGGRAWWASVSMHVLLSGGSCGGFEAAE